MAGQETYIATEELLRFLDATIDPSAWAFDLDAELASLAMMATLATAKRLAISNEAAYRLRDSAIAEVKHSELSLVVSYGETATPMADLRSARTGPE
jgi:hypothetical protein